MNFLGTHTVEFADPWLFLLLLLLPWMIWWRSRNQQGAQASFKVSSLEGLRRIPLSWKVRFRPALFYMRLAVIGLLVVALARPRISNVRENINSEGIDIVLCLDISGSMLAEDFQPNRIEAAKAVARKFIEGRPSDRIGLVIFAGESFTMCPITTDHAVLENQLAKVNSGLLEDGTAIGMGLATAVNRLRQSHAKSKVVILLTDGVNNTGLIDPMTALEIAKAYHVRVYTIGVGTHGVAPYPMPLAGGGIQMQNMPVQIDQDLLKKIAQQTGGEYFRATDNQSLKDIYAQIDRMEKTKVKMSTYKQYKDLFFPIALLAIGIFFVEAMLNYTVFRKIP